MTQSYLATENNIDRLSMSKEQADLLIKLLDGSTSIHNTDTDGDIYSTYEVLQVTYFTWYYTYVYNY